MAKFTLTIKGDTVKDADLLAAIGKETSQGVGLNTLYNDPDSWVDRMVPETLRREREEHAARTEPPSPPEPPKPTRRRSKVREVAP